MPRFTLVNLRISFCKLEKSFSTEQDFVDVYHFLFFLYRKFKEVPGALEGIRSFRDSLDRNMW